MGIRWFVGRVQKTGNCRARSRKQSAGLSAKSGSALVELAMPEALKDFPVVRAVEHEAIDLGSDAKFSCLFLIDEMPGQIDDWIE